MRYAFALTAIHLLTCLAVGQAQQNYCDISKDALTQAVQIRGLKLQRKVPCTTQNKKEVRDFISKTIDTKLPAGKLENEELLYRALGVIPTTFQYKEGMLKLYSEQIGGYYDPDRKRFVMAAWMPAFLQFPVAVHELTHALQDQHYRLDKLIDMKSDNSDSLLARSALVEGDATAVMLDYTRRLLGQGPLREEKDVSTAMMQNVMSIGMLAGLAEIPQALKVMLIFPYTSGLNFAHHLLKQNGYRAIDKAFSAIPRSTEEILHPEKYGKPADFIEIPDPPDPFQGEGSLVYRDTLGEFTISALLSNYATDKMRAADAAAGWGGDRAVVYSSKLGKKGVVWKTHWDSEKDALQFHDAYRIVLQARAEDARPEGMANQIDWKLKDGSQARLERKGRYVVFAWHG